MLFLRINCLESNINVMNVYSLVGKSGTIRLTSITDKTKFLIFKFVDFTSVQNTRAEINVIAPAIGFSSNSPFSTNDLINISIDIDGKDGSQGAQGSIGYQGAKGFGAQGFTGSQGYTGFQGDVGARGYKGYLRARQWLLKKISKY